MKEQLKIHPVDPWPRCQLIFIATFHHIFDIQAPVNIICWNTSKIVTIPSQRRLFIRLNPFWQEHLQLPGIFSQIWSHRVRWLVELHSSISTNMRNKAEKRKCCLKSETKLTTSACNVHQCHLQSDYFLSSSQYNVKLFLNLSTMIFRLATPAFFTDWEFTLTL